MVTVTLENWTRGLSWRQKFGGDYIVRKGVESLVNKWKATRRMAIAKREGTCDEVQDRMDSELEELLHKAGSATYKEQGIPTYVDLLRWVTWYESDGPDDTDEWNLFKTYVNFAVEDLVNSHSLSEILIQWEIDVVRLSGFSSEISPIFLSSYWLPSDGGEG